MRSFNFNILKIEIFNNFFFFFKNLEYAFIKYKITAAQLLSVEGFCGMLFCLMVLPILHYYPCTFKEGCLSING